MFLGIDLGTSEVKVVLVNGASDIIASANVRLDVSRPKTQWAEQNPEDWWNAVLLGVKQLKNAAQHELSGVRAIGLSGQMHGATLLDHRDKPLRPAILWNDARAGNECSELETLVPSLWEITGNMAMPGFTAPKISWVAKHEPALFARIASVLLPKDYLRLRLTGDKVSDMSDSSGTLWLDVGARCWSDTMLSATGLDAGHMPKLVEGSEPTGYLRPELASQWGIQHPVVVAGGAGDNAASAVGLGAVCTGDSFISLGTSGVLFSVDSRFHHAERSAVHSFCHALPDLWHRMSVMLSAASCLRWAATVAGAKKEEDLLQEIATIATEARARAPIFLPYLSGERTPHNDPDAKGVLFGLTHETGRAAFGYSVLEGVAFGLADGLAALAAAGTAPSSLSLVGGGARSRYWAQLIADTLDLPIHTHTAAEASAALGAARLAQLALGADKKEVCQKPVITGTCEPSSNRAYLNDRLNRYRSLYHLLKEAFDPAKLSQKGP